MSTNQEKTKCMAVENFMIELDVDEQSQNVSQKRKKSLMRRKEKNLLKHAKKKQKHKQRSSLELLNTYEIKKSKKVIIIDEKDQPKMKKKKDVDETCQETKEMIRMTEMLNQITNDQQAINNEEIKLQRKKSIPTLITDASIQTDETCDVKKLEVFHLLKLTQNFILSMHNVTEKALRIYNS